MYNYPKFQLLFIQNQFPKPIANQMQLGKKILDTILYKITVNKMANQNLYNLLSNDIKVTFSQLTQVFGQEHLYMCMGKIVNNGKYQTLIQLETQLQKCIRNQQKKIAGHSMANLTQQNIHQDNSLNKTSDNSYQTSFKGLNMQYRNPGEKSFQTRIGQILKNQLSMINKNKQQQEQQDQQQQDEQQLLKQLQLMQNESFSSKQKSQNSGISISSSSKSSSTYNLPQIAVQQYLKTQVKNFNVQLNYLKQKMKLREIQWNQDFAYENGIQMFEQQKTIIVPKQFSSSFSDVQISAKGKSTKKQLARQQASKKILRIIYERYPRIFLTFREIKYKQKLVS